MEIEIESGLRFKLDKEFHTASVIESPRASNSILIPKSVQNNGQDYKIISIQEFAFLNKSIECVAFPLDSEVYSFEACSFNCTSIKKLQIPSNLSILENCWSLGVSDLVEIEVSPKNNLFSYVDHKFLVGKSEKTSIKFNVLYFARCDIEEAIIPAEIEIIKEYSFYNYSKLKKVIFPSNSEIKIIEDNAFSCTPLESIEFLSEKVEIGQNFFSSCYNLATISFPNANEIVFNNNDSMDGISIDTEIIVKNGAKLNGPCIEKIQNQIKRIDESKNISQEKENKNEIINRNDYCKLLINRIQFLENQLSKYEKVESFTEKLFNFKFDKNEDKNLVFIDDEDESSHEILEKIGEGSTSVAYKIFDHRTSQIMCKKVLKTEEKQVTFKNLQNIIKEFEVLHQIDHPCICKVIGINPQEKVISMTKSQKIDYNDDDDNDDDDENELNSKTTITTAALFTEYLPYSLKECIDKGILNNTLKTKIVVEVAFGMSHIHKLGMIHRDLKIENVMLNCIFEAKIIDFGLVHVNDIMDSNNSLTKGVGTLSYMSPEIVNEEDYDQKTDVYSFGVFLFVLFTGRLPKQKLKDKLTNKPQNFPRPSLFISQYCVELIKKCMSYEPVNRPTFDEIIEDLKNHSFSLASGVDTKMIFLRYATLCQS